MIDFVVVPPCQVKGRRVPSFRIAKHVVTIGQYEQFARAAGYRTMAEQEEDTSFRSHGGVCLGIEVPVALQPAAYLSWHDCEAFCTHYGYSLPTEEQWLAASVIDWSREYDWNTYNSKLVEGGFEPRIDVVSPEWTATVDADGRALVRAHPRYLLVEGWQDRRSFLDRAFFNEVISFRVVDTQHEGNGR